MTQTIAIVGRPNVGKSTLFNRLIIKSSHRNITHDAPGVTRDYKTAEAKLFNLKFNLIDTAGLNQNKSSELLDQIKNQTESAIKFVNLILFVVDAKAGITSQDKALSSWLRKKNLPIILVVNKCDDEKQFTDRAAEFSELGYDEMCAVSSEHKLGFDTLHHALARHCEALQSKAVAITTNRHCEPLCNKGVAIHTSHERFRISILGRPNAGKSTLINAFLGENRLITSSAAGTTRGSTSVDLQYKGRAMQIIDTAGLRKKRKIQDKVEQLSVQQVIEAARASHVIVLLLDAKQPFEKQDLKIAELILSHLKPLVIAINKIDSIERTDEFKDEMKFIVRRKLAQQGIPIVYASALKKKNIHKILDECIKLYEARGIKISTSKLNSWLRQAIDDHQLPLMPSGHRVKIKFINQTQVYPPTFQIFTSNPDAVPDSYMKYLSNSLKNNFPQLSGPVRIKKVKSKNPYAGSGRKD